MLNVGWKTAPPLGTRARGHSGRSGAGASTARLLGSSLVTLLCPDETRQASDSAHRNESSAASRARRRGLASARSRSAMPVRENPSVSRAADAPERAVAGPVRRSALRRTAVRHRQGGRRTRHDRTAFALPSAQFARKPSLRCPMLLCPAPRNHAAHRDERAKNTDFRTSHVIPLALPNARFGGARASARIWFGSIRGRRVPLTVESDRPQLSCQGRIEAASASSRHCVVKYSFGTRDAHWRRRKVPTLSEAATLNGLQPHARVYRC